MATAGYNTSLKLSSDTTTLTDEPCTAVSAGSIYQVTNTAKRVLDPATAITVKDNGVTVTATLYSLDLLYGKVTFSGYTASGPVTITGAAVNRVTLVEATEVSQTFTADMQDATVFSSAGVKLRKATLEDYSADVSSLSNALADQDPGAATDKLYTLWSNRTPVLLEVQAPGDSNIFRAWCVISEIGHKASPDSLDTMTLKLQLAARTATGRSDQAGFGYSN